MSYSEDFKFYVATIYGEAANSTEKSWKTIAHSINNRIGFGDWAYTRDAIHVIRQTRYDANMGSGNPPFRNAIRAFRENKIPPLLNNMIQAVEPIFYQHEPDFTGGVVSYYSPRAQAQLHGEFPEKYTSVVPHWAESHPFVKVNISGTTGDDFAWFKVVRSRLFVKFVDKALNPLINSKVSIVFADLKPVPLLTDIITNSQGEIHPFYVKYDMGVRFKVDGKLLSNSSGRVIRLIADGKNYEAVIVVDNGKGGIKAKTETHEQQPNVQPPIENKTTQNSLGTQKNNHSSEKNKDVTFSLKVIDSDGNLINGNLSYILQYKNNKKPHTAINGVEQNIKAESGQRIDFLMSGVDSDQFISYFIVDSAKTEYSIQIQLFQFDILFRHNATKQSITHLNLIQSYRKKTYDKKTDSNGKITVRAMPGFDLNYKLRDGKNLITIKVDKNKPLRTLDIFEGIIDQAKNNIKNESQLSTPVESRLDPPSSNPLIIQSTIDSTSKRDQKNEINQNGHPVTRIIDNNDVEFTIITVNQQSNSIQSGLNYYITYKGNQRSHSSGTHGIGKKTHKGEAGQEIEIFIENGQSKKVSVGTYLLTKEMPEISIKCLTIDLGGISITFASSVNNALQAEVTPKTRQVLARLAKLAGKRSLVITSARRTARRQAELMYRSNIRYGVNGRTIIAISQQNIPREQALIQMEAKIIEFQKQNKIVSNHCLSPESYARKNVIDLGKNSNNAASGQALRDFHNICKQAEREGWITKAITPIDDSAEGAFHIEINQ